MRLTPTSARTGAIAVAAGTLVAGALLTAPATQAAPPAASATGAAAVSASGPQGGDPIPGGTPRCSIGFNVRDSNNVYYFLTTRHCGGIIGSKWYTDSSHTQVLGTTVGVSPSNKDYALVKYASGITPPGTVNLYNFTSQDITSAANPYVGEPVKRSGATHVRSGTVTAVNVTVNYAEGAVTGLIKTNICAEGSDVGGPLFDGAKALGLTSSASANCTIGGTTYFQPVIEPLAVYGVNVY